MEYQTVAPTRELPATDTLIRSADGVYIRMRVTSKTTGGEVLEGTPAPGDVETINFKFQTSLCKDDSGDVREDSTGCHMVLRAKVYAISADALLSKKVSFEAWLADCMDEAIQIAFRKAHILDQVLSRLLTQPVRPA